jgi:uncharacterized repeat protein (TIGR02543 family)
VITAPVQSVDAKVEIKLSNVDDAGYFERAPWNGNHVYFRIDEAGIGWPTAAQNRKVEIDGDDITVSFTVSDTEGSTGTITLPYNFNGSIFGGWLPSGKTIARVTTGGDIAAPKTLTATASPNSDGGLNFYASPSTTRLNLDKTRRLNLYASQNNTALSPWRSEPDTSYTMILTYPKKAVLNIPAKPNYGSASYKIDESDPDTNTITWDLGLVGADGFPHGPEWKTSGSIYSNAGYEANKDFNIKFPSSDFQDNDSITLRASVISTCAGATTPTTTNGSITFKLIKPAAVHIDPIANFMFNTRLHLNKGVSVYSYNPAQAVNGGTEPVPETHYTWYNDVDKTGKKLNVSSVAITNTDARYKTKLIYHIGGGSEERQVVYYLAAASSAGNSSSVNTSVALGASLGTGEYVERIEAWPLGNDPGDTVTPDNEKLELPAGATMRFSLSLANWLGDTYPNGTAVKINDFVTTKADLEWKGEMRQDLHTGSYVTGRHEEADGSYTMKLSTFNTEKYSRVYFVDNPVIPQVQWIYQSGQTGLKNPGAEIGMNLCFWSASWTFARGPWVNPVLYYLPPNDLEIDTTQTLKVFAGNADGTGTPLTTASIEETTVQGKRAYKIKMNTPMTLTADSASTANARYIPVTVKLREGATSGNIYFNHSAGTGYPDKAGLLFGVSEDAPFTIPVDYGSYYKDTTNLDGNPNTPVLVSTTSPLLNVAQLDGMSVIAEMLNNRLGDTPVWQNVNITGAEATVATNAGGEGKFRLTLNNNGNSYLGDIRLLDILPFVGDKTVRNPTQPKGSQWAAMLKEKLDVKIFDSENKDVTSQFSGAYTINYSTQGDPTYDGGSGGIVRSGGGTFSGSTAFNASTAYKSFLFNWNSTTKRLPPNHKLVITGVIKAPAGVTEDDDGKVAYNAFASQAKYFATSNAAASTGTTALLSEPKKQMFILADLGDATISKGGYVFKDYNGNGLFDTGVDVKYADVAVERYKADASGNPTGPCLQTVATDENGQYAFFNVKGGSYVIKVVKPDGAAYSFAAQGADAAATASHVDENGFGNKFTLNASATKPAPTNAGIKATGTVTVQFRVGTEAGTQVGSDIIAAMPLLGAPDVDGKNAKGSITAGQGSVIIPAHYQLKGTETSIKSYALSWDEPAQTIVYVVEPDTYTVSYHANKPANATGEVTSVSGMTDDTAVYDQNFTLKTNDFALTGYDFGGWNTDADGTSGTDYAGGFAFTPWNLTGNLTLYAKWTARENISLTFDANGGIGGAVTGWTNLMFDKTLAAQNKTLPVASPDAPTRTGYTFGGWSTAPGVFTAGVGTDNTADFTGETVVDWTGAKTVYAVWAAKSVAITYLYEGSAAYTDQNATNAAATKENSGAYDATLASAPTPEPTRTGYTFGGWYVDPASGSEWEFGIGKTPLTAAYGVIGAEDASPTLTLHAKWTANPVTATYALTVINGGGGGSFAAGTTVNITATPASLGRAFDTWESGNGGTFGDVNNPVTTFIMPANAVTVTATYKNTGIPSPEAYALTVVNGTDSTNAGPYTAGTRIRITADKAPLGRAFDTWESGNGGTFADAASAETTFIMPTNAVTVTATHKDASPMIHHVEKDFGTYTGTGSVFAKVNIDHTAFVRLLLADREVSPANYTVAEGSTIITLQRDYLKTFKNGTYWFTAEFADNTKVLIRLVVEVKNAPNPGAKVSGGSGFGGNDPGHKTAWRDADGAAKASGKTTVTDPPVRTGEPKTDSRAVTGTAKSDTNLALWPALIAALGAILIAVIIIIVRKKRSEEEEVK